MTINVDDFGHGKRFKMHQSLLQPPERLSRKI